jgi:hypothetical protein
MPENDFTFLRVYLGLLKYVLFHHRILVLRLENIQSHLGKPINLNFNSSKWDGVNKEK